MSLLDEYYENFTLITKTIAPDGYGGYDTAWVPAGKFKAAVVLDTSIQARIGEKQGVTALYTVTTPTAMDLGYYDVIRRDSDGKTFRITSDGTDKHTPQSATIDMRQVSAEEWVIAEGNNG